MSDTLNSLIFIDIIPYLSINKSFNELLDIALTSKPTFKIIQNLITNQSKKLNITLGSLSALKSYISNSNNVGNYNSYNNKLIQYKEIKYIQCKLDNLSYTKSNKRDYGGFNDSVTKSTLEYKLFLNENCPNLTRVYIHKYLYSANDEIHDYTIDGFYKFKGLHIEIDISNDQMPISNEDENDALRYSQDSAYQFQFSFQLVKNYNPKKVIITNGDEYNYSCGLDNILNFKCIKSLKFIDQPTPPAFIDKILQSKSIKSISLNYLPENYDFEDQIEEEEYEDEEDDAAENDIDSDKEDEENLEEENEEDDEDEYTHDMVESLSNGLTNNQTLTKLSLSKCVQANLKFKNPTELFQLIDSISSTTKLKKLDLSCFDITNSRLLSPLIDIPFISTLYYNERNIVTQNNFSTLKAYFIHLNENENIKTFKCYFLDTLNSKEENILVKRFNKFFNFNKSVDKLIIGGFENLYGNTNTTIHKKIKDSLASSYNNHLNLIFK